MFHYCARVSHGSCRARTLDASWQLQSTGSRCVGSVVVVYRLSCSKTCGIFPDQGSNPCSLHWQVDSQPLDHRGSTYMVVFPLSVVLQYFLNFLFHFCPIGFFSSMLFNFHVIFFFPLLISLSVNDFLASCLCGQKRCLT